MSQTKFENTYCNQCRKKTRHAIVAESTRTGSEGLVDVSRTSSILECGCEHTVLRKRVHFSEFQECPGDLDPDDEFFPPHSSHYEPAWVDSLDSHTLKAVLREVYLSLNAGLRFLAAVGIRTGLDLIIKEKVGDIGQFEKKLDELVTAGFVSSEERDRLDVLAEAGNAAAHRGYTPTPEALTVVLGILELLIYRLYVETKHAAELSVAADKIRQTIPRRNNVKKPRSA